MLISLLAFAFIILICVIVHELGHYVTALLCGVQVHEFSFGMGPALWQRQGKRNLWSFRALPVGGFVRLAGMGEERDQELVQPGMGFLEKPSWKRLIILSAGSFNNILLVVLLATAILWCHGVLDLSRAEVGSVMAGYPAEGAGLQSGDQLLEVNGKAVEDWASMTQEIRLAGERSAPARLVVRRGDQEFILDLMPRLDPESQRPLIGITPPVRRFSLWQAAAHSLGYTVNMTLLMVRGLVQMIAHPSQAEVAGPVGIATMAGDAAEAGFWPLISFLAMISLNLGILNLLPFPALDGGRILFVAVEMVLGRPLSEEVEGRIHFVGFLILMALILLVTWQDVAKLLER